MSNFVSCINLEKFQMQLRTKEHSWIADEPVELDGDGLGPNPFDLLLASLASCTTATVYYYAAQVGIGVERIHVDVDGRWDDPKKKNQYLIKVNLRVGGDLDEKDLKRLQTAAGRCPVKRILGQGARIDLEIEKIRADRASGLVKDRRDGRPVPSGPEGTARTSAGTA